MFEGPDRTGKSNIAAALGKTLNIPVYKNSIEHKLYNTDSTFLFKDVVSISAPIELKFASLFKSVIFDRNFISEWVYGKAAYRKIDENLLLKLDEEYGKLGAIVIYCYKTKYKEFDDEHHEVSHMRKIDSLYKFYLTTKTTMRVVWLNTTDENINSQLDFLLKTLKG